MFFRIGAMKLIIEENSEKAAEFAALYIKKRINDFKPTADRPFTLGLHAGLFEIFLLFCLYPMVCAKF